MGLPPAGRVEREHRLEHAPVARAEAPRHRAQPERLRTAAAPIYVETRIRAPLDDVWEKTQRPELHRRWDLRFTSIEYLPRADGEPQRFRYATRLGFGLRVEGTGESVGEREGTNGARTSALTFRSDDPKSLIRAGSGSNPRWGRLFGYRGWFTAEERGVRPLREERRE